MTTPASNSVGNGRAIGVWRWLASILAAALLAGASTWYAMAGTAASQADLQALEGSVQEDIRGIREQLLKLSVNLAEFRGEFRQWRTQRPAAKE